MNEHLKRLEARIASRKARIAVVGLGYVGLPLAVEFARSGFRVTGIDVDPAKARNILAGRSHVEDDPSAAVRELVRKGLLCAQDHYRGCVVHDAIGIRLPCHSP